MTNILPVLRVSASYLCLIVLDGLCDYPSAPRSWILLYTIGYAWSAYRLLSESILGLDSFSCASQYFSNSILAGYPLALMCNGVHVLLHWSEQSSITKVVLVAQDIMERCFGIGGALGSNHYNEHHHGLKPDMDECTVDPHVYAFLWKRLHPCRRVATIMMCLVLGLWDPVMSRALMMVYAALCLCDVLPI